MLRYKNPTSCLLANPAREKAASAPEAESAKAASALENPGKEKENPASALENQKEKVENLASAVQENPLLPASFTPIPMVVFI